MPEEIQVAASPTQNNASDNSQSQIQAELKQQMETSLAGFVPGMQVAKPPIQEAVTVVQQPEIKPTQEAATVLTPTEPFSILKEKFGWQKPEDALVEVEELRAFKNAPVTTTEMKFENEDSEKLFKAIVGGKRKEAYQILDRLEKIDSLTGIDVTKDNAASIIKLGMQLKYPNLSQEEIDYRFNKQFTYPKSPIWDKENETEEDFGSRKAEWQSMVDDIEINKRIEAKLVIPELETHKSKIVLPEIENPVDEGYAQYRKMLEDEPKLNTEIRELYKKITPQALETKIKFTDEPNKIDFEFQYVPDGDSFNKAIDIASDWNKIIDHFKKPDGSPDREGFAKAMHFMLNSKSIITEAINQGKNAALKANLADNGGGGIQRQFPQRQELSELDKQMQMSLSLNGQRR